MLSTLQGYFGGLYSSNFNRFGKIYRVIVQAEFSARANIESLNNIKVRNARGQMAPITQFMTLTPTEGPDNINRFNMFTSISINGNPADGYTSGQAIQAVEEVAKASLPVGYTYEYSGLTREEQSSSGNTTAIVFFASSSSICCSLRNMRAISCLLPCSSPCLLVCLVRSFSSKASVV